MNKGIKYDGGSEKFRWSLFPKYVLWEVLKVLEYGARKYAPNNWKHVKPLRERYYDAMNRHLRVWWEDGEIMDPETGYPHMAHLICCAMFCLYFDILWAIKKGVHKRTVPSREEIHAKIDKTQREDRK